MRAPLGASLAILVAAVACGAGGATGTSPRTGLFGMVTKGPLQPVCSPDVACEGPAAGVRLVFVRNGTVAARTTTRDDGRYRVALAPGRYRIRAGSTGLAPHPQVAIVPRGRFHRLDLFVDTGIR